MYQQLKQVNEKIKPELIRFTQELIRTPSSSLSEGEVAWRVTELLEHLGYNLVFNDDAGNVVGVLLQERGEPTVLLNAHMDTVTPAEADWKRKPYAAEIDQGRIWGVGAADCKSGLAAQIFAGYVLNQVALPLKGNLIFAATVAEENGCSGGLKYLLDDTLPRLGVKPTLAILGEPTSLNLCCGHDGWLEADVRITGKSRAQVEKAAQLILESLQCADGNVCVQGGRSVMQASAPKFEETAKFKRALLQISRRLYPGERAGEFVVWMQRRAEALLTSMDGAKVEVRAHQESQRLYTGKMQDVEAVRPAWSMEPFEPVVDEAREGLLAGGCHCTSSMMRLERLGMGTGGGLIACENGIPTLGYGPGEESCAHGTDESVSIDKLCEAAYGTAVLAHRFIGAPVFGIAS